MISDILYDPQSPEHHEVWPPERKKDRKNRKEEERPIVKRNKIKRKIKKY